MKKGKVLVVFCIDTEGPFTDPNYYQPSQLLGNWPDIDKIFLSKVFSDQFRFAFPDSNKSGSVFTWFTLNWTGFRTNPIEHDLGYHKIYDHYTKVWGKHLKKYGDELAWHYHHLSLSGVGNEWGLNWFDNKEYENILCRMIIDRNFFPISYRAGGTIEDNNQSNWLENWIPFDYSNRSSQSVNWDKIEADGRRLRELVDWSKAPSDWSIYHPDPSDFRKPGLMKRFMAKSLDIKSGAHTLTKKDIEKAFESTQSGRDLIFSSFEHDFRDRSEEIIQVMSWIHELSQKTGVKFYYASAKDAMKKLNNFSQKNNFKLSIKRNKSSLTIKSNKPLFNPQPFLAIKYSTNLYRWQPVFKLTETTWEYLLIKEDCAKLMGLAAHDMEGNTFVKVFQI